MNEFSGFSQKIADDIIRLAQKGDVKAMEVIYDTYADACFSLAMRILSDPVRAEDVVQNSFIKAMQNISRFEFTGVFAGWLRQITVNETLLMTRTHNKQRNFELTENADSRGDHFNHEDTNHYFDTNWWEASSDLASLTRQLPLEARTVLFLHEIEGYSHKEIADLLDKTESYSKQTLSRALKKLKKSSQKEGTDRG